MKLEYILWMFLGVLLYKLIQKIVDECYKSAYSEDEVYEVISRNEPKNIWQILKEVNNNRRDRNPMTVKKLKWILNDLMRFAKVRRNNFYNTEKEDQVTYVRMFP